MDVGETTPVVFETRSARVNCVRLHERLCLLVAALRNGVVQVWDYEKAVLVARFLHRCPVRCVDFHKGAGGDDGKQMSLIVSGGDDGKIKVWDYLTKRCFFTIQDAHDDIVRTVQFHPAEFPWILSASDDHRLHIWDYEKRTCLITCFGHKQAVMSATFHPTEDLIVSASRDRTVRVWDMQSMCQTARGLPRRWKNGVVVKFLLEGHKLGVNFAAFHPKLPLLVSADDNRKVKIWRLSETKAWEVRTISGHSNSATCCLFLEDAVLSTSLDGSLLVWSVLRLVAVQSIRISHSLEESKKEGCWSLDSLPSSHLVAVGHESGLVIFRMHSLSALEGCTGDMSSTVLASSGIHRVVESDAEDFEECTRFESKHETKRTLESRRLRKVGAAISRRLPLILFGLLVGLLIALSDLAVNFLFSFVLVVPFFYKKCFQINVPKHRASFIEGNDDELIPLVDGGDGVELL